jgi:hypothetical protein
VTEIAGPVDLSDWPSRIGTVVRREDAHPGVQLTLSDVDEHRFQVSVTTRRLPRGVWWRRECPGGSAGVVEG